MNLNLELDKCLIRIYHLKNELKDTIKEMELKCQKMN